MSTLIPEDVVEDVLAVVIDPDVATLDACLADVTSRSTVYAREIFEPLETIDNPAVAICVAILRPLVSHIDDTDYLHCRDFLDPLLDLRSALKYP